MKGLIVIGYQGIGKSSIGGKYNCIDLESSNFYIDNQRDKDWYKPYCNIALHLANQGYVVMTSSHKNVRNYFSTFLNKLPENIGNIVIFCPRQTQKEQWIERLRKRHDKTKSDKDYRALMNAVEMYDMNIGEMTHSKFCCYHPESMNYDLYDEILYMLYDWCL